MCLGRWRNPQIFLPPGQPIEWKSAAALRQPIVVGGVLRGAAETRKCYDRVGKGEGLSLRRWNPMANIKDVARESGFSPSTVSIVLNDAPLARYIPQRTKDQILRAAKRLRYSPNPFARSLSSTRSHTVGVITSDTLDPYFTQIIRGIHNALFHSSFLPVLADIQNQRARFERYLEMLLERRVEGLITIANSLLVDMDVLGVVEEQRTPSVIIGREPVFASMSSVVIDNEAGCALR